MRMPSPVLALLLGAVSLTAGCCYTHYADSRVSVSRLSIGTDARASKVSVTCTDKTTTVRVGELEVAEAAVVGAVVSGVVSGVTP